MNRYFVTCEVHANNEREAKEKFTHTNIEEITECELDEEDIDLVEEEDDEDLDDDSDDED